MSFPQDEDISRAWVSKPWRGTQQHRWVQGGSGCCWGRAGPGRQAGLQPAHPTSAQGATHFLIRNDPAKPQAPGNCFSSNKGADSSMRRGSPGRGQRGGQASRSGFGRSLGTSLPEGFNGKHKCVRLGVSQGACARSCYLLNTWGLFNYDDSLLGNEYF